MTIPFAKPATTFPQQVSLLKQRGMTIDDSAEAEFYLRHLNYYRLGAYWLPFESDHTSHQFRSNTHFNDVLNLYIFDRELRLLVLDAIERIEVSVRCQWAYCLAHNHGTHAHLDATLAFNRGFWQSNLDKLTSEVQRSDEVFIKHLLATYSEPLPPVWAVCEVMSLGLLSRWYNALKPMRTRRAIASVYGLDERVLQSWLHHLSYLRNLCAHHSRLWNRDFPITPEIPKNKPARLNGEFIAGSRRIYNTCIILLHFMNIIAPQHHWRPRFKALVAQHNINVHSMGFPNDWEQCPVWQGGHP